MVAFLTHNPLIIVRKCFNAPTDYNVGNSRRENRYKIYSSDRHRAIHGTYKCIKRHPLGKIFIPT